MKINPKCLLDYLEKNGIDCLYVDNFRITNVIYHFNNYIQFSIEENCITLPVLKSYLRQFSLNFDENYFISSACQCQY